MNNVLRAKPGKHSDCLRWSICVCVGGEGEEVREKVRKEDENKGEKQMKEDSKGESINVKRRDEKSRKNRR